MFIELSRIFAPKTTMGSGVLLSETKTAEWKKRRCFTKKMERVLFAGMTDCSGSCYWRSEKKLLPKQFLWPFVVTVVLTVKEFAHSKMFVGPTNI